jgi:hypothetical protein
VRTDRRHQGADLKQETATSVHRRGDPVAGRVRPRDPGRLRPGAEGSVDQDDREPVSGYVGLRSRQSPGAARRGPLALLIDDAHDLHPKMLFGRHLGCTQEEGYKVCQKPVSAELIDTVIAKDIDELEPRLTRQGYHMKASPFDPFPPHIRPEELPIRARFSYVLGAGQRRRTMP